MRDLSFLDDIIACARRQGADSADAILINSNSLSVDWRCNQVESLEQSQSGDLGLRVFIGQQQAMVSTTNREWTNIQTLVERALSMAKLAPEDPLCGLTPAHEVGKDWPSLSLADTTAPTADQLLALTAEAESSALSISGITNSDGASASASRTGIAFVASNGFSGHYERTSYATSISVLAGTNTSMQRDYAYSHCVRFSDLLSPSALGQTAAERTLKKLNPRKVATTRAPIIFSPRVSNSIVGSIASAISGTAVARGTSFLKDNLHHIIAHSGITIIDDPHRAWGLRSRPFDAEGRVPTRRAIVDKGRLTSWLLDNRSARQLGMTSTAHATRSTGGSPSPSASNFYIEPGNQSPAELMADIQHGFYVTELMGTGVNNVTGDYSQAASGFWIVDGLPTYAVSEVTIASNLKDMYLHMFPANDLSFDYGFDSPTLRIEGMTIAGI